MFIELNKRRAVRRIIAIDTSYEMVWATDRIAPIMVYLELDAHPLINTVYTLILDTHKKYRIPNDINMVGLLCGNRSQNNSASISVEAGAMINTIVLIIEGLDDSFINNFMASAIGWGIPDNITLFGPFRS